MIAGPERPQLGCAALLSARAHGGAIGPTETAALFGMVKIGFRSHPFFNRPTGTDLKDLIQIVAGNVELSGLSSTRRNVAEQLIYQLTKLGSNLVYRERG